MWPPTSASVPQDGQARGVTLVSASDAEETLLNGPLLLNV